MTTFAELDRVHIHGRSDYLGTVTADRDSMFPIMRGVRWDDGEFAFVNPIKLAHVDPVAIPGMTEGERVALGEAYRSALDAVDPIGFVTATNTPTDWQTRATQAEAKLAVVMARIKDAEAREDNITPKWLRKAIEALDADR